MTHHLACSVLQLGDARLRRRAETVPLPGDQKLRREAQTLQETLDRFRARHGFGRAIAAPQLGFARRLIALHLSEWPKWVLNPEIVWRSPERITLWDDCMSFPFLLVRVERHACVRVRYCDIEGAQQETAELDVATSELLQHEIDHLDGVLAVDRAIDKQALVAREEFERDPAGYRSQVDWTPGAGRVESEGGPSQQDS